ncbi:efflux RND transporter permease subunit [Cupriavidus oxalaticus]|jgi:multidrug efflux pump|uniref:Efflux RND transporter permease subunit n=1 Tax=Cupriavidus oxalaticus TaxID=96344 RepID=A0A375G9U6_9BURK|nr:efflux RND transporter permease subunit [Cupriavidus oxalaticus]QRQ86880.1 efflux RND transporter permease subunit [Cupriavidus oxalaticus]QRQ94792.1 efflux RND transporter permease subunit [Cupriavidus oxalaticus]WQD83443.1 efflux RND transporter permease subunit [Cupriavidus oxalaticus]SPC16273.1 multidrug efflux system, subunit C [Cupriavidus oxalaticus]
MNLSAAFIHRPVATALLTLGILLAGLAALRLLPVSPLPQVDFPTISVSASLPGASPETMAATVATPLERALGTIAGVTEITSSSSLGSTRVTLQFDLSRDIDGAARDVQAAINASRATLPTSLPNNPTYRKVNPADAPIMIIALTSPTMTRGQLYDAASTILAQKLSQVEGVGQVTIGGASLPAVRVELNPTALNNYGISLEDVRNTISATNANRPLGTLENASNNWQVYANDQMMKAEDYMPLIIRYATPGTYSSASAGALIASTANATASGGVSTKVVNGVTVTTLTTSSGTTTITSGATGGASATSGPNSFAVPVRLRDVANVVDSVQDIRNAGSANGKPSVLLVLNRSPGANIIETVDRVREMLPNLQKMIPAAISMDVMMDRTPTIRASLREVEHTLMISVALVIMVVFIFLRNVRATLIPSVAVPVSLIGTFTVMYLAGFSLNNLSLMALTIATGFVVDDAIVVLENISRHLEEGMKPLAAALRGAREVGFTVLSMSLSLIAVFIPLLLMGGIVGRLFQEFAITLSVAILVSLVVSLTTTPMMCARMLRPVEPEKQGRFFRATERMFQWLQDGYARSLSTALRLSPLVWLVLIATIALNVYLYVIVPKGFFPQQDTGRLIGFIRADQATSFQAMRGKLDSFIKIVQSDPAVENVTGFTGGSQRNTGQMFVTLKPLAERKESADAIIARLRDKLAKEPGARLFLQPVQDIRVGGRQSSSQYQFTLQSDDLEVLRAWEPKVRAALSNLKGLEDIDTDTNDKGLQTSVIIDRDAASRLGVTAQQVDAVLNNAFGQRLVSTIYHPLNQYRVVMELSPEYLQGPNALKDIYVVTGNGNRVPLSAFARVIPTSTPLGVSHQGQFAASTISFNLAQGTSLSQATDAINREMARIGVPETLRANFQGGAKAFQDSLKSQPVLILAALVTIYIVLGVLYESYVHPLTILSTLPSAGVGALLALMASKTDFSIIALIGVILLIGIVKKNAIMMIDFAIDAERREGLSPRDAIYRACLLRFRPILMTTMAALLGAVPLAIGRGDGAELRAPLGISIVGGLVVSQLLTLYTTPVVYLTLDRWRLKVKAWRRRRRGGTPDQPAAV